MTRLIEDTAGKIRNKPITDALRLLLIKAGEAAGVDVVRVTSGGQDKLGTPGARRTGSTRHDLGNAADLVLEKGGRTLSFAVSGELPVFEQFIAAAVAEGATGVGAGIGYMGPNTMHVGFGSEAVWGAGGKSANAPSWIVRAAERGRAARGGGAPLPAAPQPIADPGRKLYSVIARSGLRLRSGPGTSYPAVRALPAGTRLTGVVYAADREWMHVDLEQDGLFDGYVFAAYLAEA